MKIRRTGSSRQLKESDVVVGSRDAEDAVTRQSGPEKTLGLLFEDHEDLLLKVLSNIIDDGLHECRRVCRCWRDACGKLPVKLGSQCRDKLVEAAELFPEAVSLTLEGCFRMDDFLERQAVQRLSRLENLQSLSLVAYSKLAAVDRLVTLLPSTDILRCLDVTVDHKDILDDIVRALRRMPNLEELIVFVTTFIQTDLDPVTELRRLECLKTGFPVMFNSRGDLLFPSLTRLTRLSLRHIHEDVPHTFFSLQSMLPYSQTLQSLKLVHWYQSKGLWLAEEHQWRAFSRLSSLSVSRHSYQPRDSFFRALGGMHHLTKLKFEDNKAQDHRALVDCLPSLTGLRSLILIGSFQWSTLSENEERCLMALTQLTELALKYYQIGYGRRLPTGIQSLTCRFSGRPPADFPEILMSMTNLASLSVLIPSGFERFFHRQSATPSQFSQELGRLKHLSTLNVVVDDLFLEALDMLTHLTSLQLANSSASVDPYLLFPRLNKLSDLVELEISSPVVIPVRNDGFPQLCLPRIRKINLPLRGIDDNMREALWKTLPCLREMSFPREPLTFE